MITKLEFEAQTQQIIPLREKRNAKILLIRKVKIIESGNLKALQEILYPALSVM